MFAPSPSEHWPPHTHRPGGLGFSDPSQQGSVVSEIVGMAFNIFSAISAKNQAIIDGLVQDQTAIKAAQDEMFLLLTQLRVARDGLLQEKAMLLGDRARAGLGLFKSRRVKKAHAKVSGGKQILTDMMEQANELHAEISQLAQEVSALRHELGVREDKPLTYLEASLKPANTGDKMALYMVGGLLAFLLLLIAIKK